MVSSFNIKKHKKTGALCWFFLIIALSSNMFSMDVYLPAMPVIAEELKTTGFLLKIIFIINFIEFSLSPMIWGTFADLKGRRGAIIICMLLAITGQAISSFALNGYVLMIGRVIQFMGAGALSSIILTLICDNFEGASRAKAIAIFEFSLPLAVITGPLIGVSLMDYMGWRKTFVVFTLIQIISAIGIYLTFSETLKTQKEHKISEALENIYAIFKSKTVLSIIFVLGLSEGVWMIYVVSSTFFYLQAFKVTPMHYVYYQSAATVSFLLGVASYSFAVDKVGIKKCFDIGVFGFITAGFVAVLFCTSLVSTNPMNLCLLISLMNFFCGIICPSGNSIALNQVNQNFIATSAATITSIINFIVGFAMLFGTFILGSYPNTDFFACIVAAAFAIYFLWLLITKQYKKYGA